MGMVLSHAEAARMKTAARVRCVRGWFHGRMGKGRNATRLFGNRDLRKIKVQ